LLLLCAEKLAGKMAAHQLKQAICSKCSPDEAVNVLKDLPNPLTDDDGLNFRYFVFIFTNLSFAGSDMSGIYNPLKIEVFVQTLLNLGAKSFSHSFAAIAKCVHTLNLSFISLHILHIHYRFHQVLRAFGESQDAQICILKSVYELWHTNQHVSFNKMQNCSVNVFIVCCFFRCWSFWSINC
jgi:nuclear cap-binding protein subunit 1